ncbi:MAG: hypothetical protein WD794_06385 [Mycobacteriales bacterium]
MVVLGLILLLFCLVLSAGIALGNTEAITARAFGVSLADVSLSGLFLVGVALGAVAMVGLGLMLVGATRKRARKVALRREIRSARDEQESLAEENARLQAELEQERPAATSPVGTVPAGAAPAGTAAESTEEAPGRHRRA